MPPTRKAGEATAGLLELCSKVCASLRALGTRPSSSWGWVPCGAGRSSPRVSLLWGGGHPVRWWAREEGRVGAGPSPEPQAPSSGGPPGPRGAGPHGPGRHLPDPSQSPPLQAERCCPFGNWVFS